MDAASYIDAANPVISGALLWRVFVLEKRLDALCLFLGAPRPKNDRKQYPRPPFLVLLFVAGSVAWAVIRNL